MAAIAASDVATSVRDMQVGNVVGATAAYRKQVVNCESHWMQTRKFEIYDLAADVATIAARLKEALAGDCHRASATTLVVLLSVTP